MSTKQDKTKVSGEPLSQLEKRVARMRKQVKIDLKNWRRLYSFFRFNTAR